MNARCLLWGFFIQLILCASFASAQSPIVNSKHNLSTSGPGAIKASSQQEICVFCHTPHTSQNTAPLWNRQSTSATYTLYSSDYLTSLAYPAANQPNTRSKLCLSCHDGTIAIGAVYNVPGGGTGITMTGGVTTMPTTAAGNLGTTFVNDHPVGYSYSTSADPELVSRSWPWGTAVKLDPDNSTGRVECHSCHDAHDNQYTYFLNMSNANAAMCTFCHNKSGWNGANVVHRVSTQTYTPPGLAATTIGEWSCRSCHSSHNAGSGPYILDKTEEATCLQTACHGSSAPTTTKNIAIEYTRTYTHPTTTQTGVHKNPESSTYMGSNRHAECWDCHNAHETENGVHDGTTRDIAATGGSGVLKGVWGVDPSWSAVPTGMTNNNNTLSTVTYTVVNPATKEYQICLKCHSSYLSGTHRDIAAEINPAYPSWHGIVAGGTTNTYCNTTTMLSPWGTNKIVWCSDCHSSNASTTNGPHGSNADNLLVATAVSSSSVGTPLCLVCHNTTHYWTGSGNGSRLTDHPNNEPDHKKPKGCFSCHMYDFNSYATYSSSGGNSQQLLVHGMNKRYYYREKLSGGAIIVSTNKNYADAFIAGYVADIQFNTKSCWTESPGNAEFVSNCNYNHNPRTY